jgi:hypothetical protein
MISGIDLFSMILLAFSRCIIDLTARPSQAAKEIDYMRRIVFRSRLERVASYAMIARNRGATNESASFMLLVGIDKGTAKLSREVEEEVI